MDARFEMDDARSQPKYEVVALRDDERFGLTARLPSGETINIPRKSRIRSCPGVV